VSEAEVGHLFIGELKTPEYLQRFIASLESPWFVDAGLARRHRGNDSKCHPSLPAFGFGSCPEVSYAG